MMYNRQIRKVPATHSYTTACTTYVCGCGKRILCMQWCNNKLQELLALTPTLELDKVSPKLGDISLLHLPHIFFQKYDGPVTIVTSFTALALYREPEFQKFPIY